MILQSLIRHQCQLTIKTKNGPKQQWLPLNVGTDEIHHTVEETATRQPVLQRSYLEIVHRSHADQRLEIVNQSYADQRSSADATKRGHDHKETTSVSK